MSKKPPGIERVREAYDNLIVAVHGGNLESLKECDRVLIVRTLEAMTELIKIIQAAIAKQGRLL